MSRYEENQKKVQTILERGIGILAQEYVIRRLDAGEFGGMVTLGTQFHTAHYEIEGVGHLMTMYTEGNPHMLMSTYTLTPYLKKLPLISSDFIFDEEGGMQQEFLSRIMALTLCADFSMKFSLAFKDVTEGRGACLQRGSVIT